MCFLKTIGDHMKGSGLVDSWIESGFLGPNAAETVMNGKAYKAGFPLGGILRAERNFSLSFLISSTREITRQRKIPLRAQNSA